MKTPVRQTEKPVARRLAFCAADYEAVAGQGAKSRVDTLPTVALDFFRQYEWPGNVRELRNAVQRVLTLGDVGIQGERSSGAEDPGEEIILQDFRAARRDAIDSFEAAYLRTLYTQAHKNLSEAARASGIDRRQLRDLLKKHGLYSG